MAKNVNKSISTCLAETVQILDDLSGRQQMERILHQITQNLYEMTDCQTCAIIRLQPGYERLEIVNSQGLSWQFCKNYRHKAVHPEVRELLWQENPMSVSDAKHDDPATEAFHLEHDFKSCYCVPLMTNKQPAGYLHLDSAESDHFSPDDQLLAQMYAKIISVTMLKSNLLSSLEKRSERDIETGAIIYDIFLRRLDEAVAKAKRQGENLALILIDVVKFDNLLKLYGVETCKKLMKELLVLVKANLRLYDALSQFGADELIISLPGHTLEEATGCTRKLYDVISQTEFTEKDLKIDVSIGIAGFPEHSQTAGGLVTASKNALAESKRSPGHRIYVASHYFQ